MTKLFAILFSSLFFIQSTNIHFADMQKIGEVFEHYNMHNERYKDSLVTFLSKHYGDLKESHKQHQQEEKDHNHPPINHDCSSQIQTSFLLNVISFSIENSRTIVETSTNFYYQDEFSTFEKQEVFQPPRV